MATHMLSSSLFNLDGKDYGKDDGSRRGSAPVRPKGVSKQSKDVGAVDCPVRKYDVMHGKQTHCHGCAARTMSQVLSHLSPERSLLHHGFPSFLKRCARCKDVVIDPATWVSGAHKAGACKPRVQPRGSVVTAWARLYLTLYPSETRIPNPYTDEKGWLPDEVVSFIRSTRIDSPSDENPVRHRRPVFRTAASQEHTGLTAIGDTQPPDPIPLKDILSDATSLTSSLLNQASINLIGGPDRHKQAIEEVQTYYRQRLTTSMQAHEVAIIEKWLGLHGNVEEFEQDSGYGSTYAHSTRSQGHGSTYAPSIQSQGHDSTDANFIHSQGPGSNNGWNASDFAPWSHYNTRVTMFSQPLGRTGGSVVSDPEGIQAQQPSSGLAQSPLTLSHEPFRTSSEELSKHVPSRDTEIEDGTNDSAHSDPQLDQSNSSSRQELPPSAVACIDAVRDKFDAETCELLWKNFFRRWDGILEELNNKGSATRDVFAQVLHDIRARVQLDSSNLFVCVGNQGQQSHATQSTHANAPSSNKKRARDQNSSTSSSKKGKSRHQNEDNLEENSNNGPVVEQHNQTTRSGAAKKVDCPVFKHDRMNGMLSHACRGFPTKFLSVLQKRHLRTHGHGGLIQWVERCERCWEFVFERDLWERHNMCQCPSQPQPKGPEVVAAWARIYLTIYPDAEKVPSPYEGEYVWLPQDQTEHYRRQVQTLLPLLEDTAESFLDNQHEQTTVSDVQPLVPDDFNRAVAADVMFNDFTNSLTPMTNAIDSLSTFNFEPTSHNAGSEARAEGPSNHSLDFKARLDRASDEIVQTLKDAANHLNPTARSLLAAQAEVDLFARIESFRNWLRDQPGTQQAFEAVPPAPDCIEPRLLQSHNHIQAATLESITQPSTQGTNTDSTSCDAAARTGSTSAPDPVPAPQQWPSPPLWEAALEGVPGPSRQPNYPLRDQRENELDQIEKDTQRDPSISPGMPGIYEYPWLWDEAQ